MTWKPIGVVPVVRGQYARIDSPVYIIEWNAHTGKLRKVKVKLSELEEDEL